MSDENKPGLVAITLAVIFIVGGGYLITAATLQELPWQR